MNITRFSVQRPVFASMVSLIIMVMGLMALSRLQIDLLPAVELPTLTVRTQYEGANPVVMESLVTQIVEEIVATVPGIEEITSSSYEGNSSVKVSFGWGTPIDAVAVDVRATLEDEISELPDDITGPRVSKFDIDTYPVVILGISSRLNPVELTEIIEKQIRYRFAGIAGVAQVDPWGGFNREIRIEVSPAKINALGIPLEDILDAIRDANLNQPGGKIRQGKYEVTIRTPAEFKSVQEIRDTMIFHYNDSVVTLGQIANVLDTYEKKSRIVHVNGELGLRVAIRKEPQANTVEVAKQILKEIESVQRDFPQIQIVPVTNQGNFIQRSINNVTQSVIYGGALAVLVLLFFLRNFRSTLVISLSIPISIIATFALLYFSGFTINLMTLGGLALGVGMMVDSSVVVLENIFRRHNEYHEAVEQAAISGTNEVTSAVTAGTLTTLVIFLPLIFIDGISGELFQELAYVVMFSLLCALLIAITLLPVLAAKLMKNKSPDNNPDSSGISSSRDHTLFDKLSSSYQNLLSGSLKYSTITIIGSLLLLALSLFLTPYIGTEFLPPSDEGQVKITAEMEIGTHLEIIDEQAKKLEHLVKSLVPESVSIITSSMASGTRGSSKARVQINLTLLPAKQRKRSNKAIASDLRKQLSGKIPGLKIRIRAPQGQFILERLLKTTEGISIDVRGFNLEQLHFISQLAADKIEQIDGVTDVELNKEKGIPQQNIIIDRAKAADLGISVRDILDVIKIGIAGSKAGEYRVEGNSYRILIQLEDAENLSIDDILDLYVKTPDNHRINLRNLVRTHENTGPVSIERKNRQRYVSITANVSDRDLGSVAGDIQKAINEIIKPPGFDIVISGNYEEQQKSFDQLLTSTLLAMALVYMVLAAQYESFRDPFIVMLSVPLAAIGVILTLFLTDTTLNLQSAMGCIMLVGIVVNNAILLVDQARKSEQSGQNCVDAISEAGRRRLRPILMTSLTTILAILPLALGIGEGADSQAPLARVVIGGLAVSTIITLFFIPAVYYLFHFKKTSLKSKI